MTENDPAYWEQFIPSMEQGRYSRKLSYRSDISSFMGNTDTPQTTEQQVEAFITKLAKIGLAEHQITILLERFVNDKTFRQITKEHGFVDVGVTFYLYKQALDQVRNAMATGKGN